MTYSAGLLLSLALLLNPRRPAALFAPTAAFGSAAPPATAGAAPASTSESLSQGVAALEANQPREALADFQQVLQSEPNHATANLLAATAAIELDQGQLAVHYAEKARQLDPGNWKIHTTLVAAYTEAGMKPQRDQERALLRQMHTTGPPDARKATGFLLEMFPLQLAGQAGAGDRVDAVEEFEPMGSFHTYYRFLVHRPDGRRVLEIDIQSNDFDEHSWAQAHPTEAAAGQRQFQIVGHTGTNPEIDYRMFSGKPEYDDIRVMVIEILRTHPIPSS
jgi:tetratricopeptide (TPR) repeat protein